MVPFTRVGSKPAVTGTTIICSAWPASAETLEVARTAVPWPEGATAGVASDGEAKAGAAATPNALTVASASVAAQASMIRTG